MRQADRELETERLRFRPLRESDFPVIERHCADINVMRFLGGKTLDTAQAWRHMAYQIGHWQLLGYGYYAVEEKATGIFVGRCGYTNHAGWPAFELGWTIWPEYQGRGFASEAANMLLRYAFDKLDQPHVVSLIHRDNAPSRRVAEKLGEKIEGEAEVLGMPVLIYGIDRP
jgi:RimJ/RimL family protein N-acetyltransferase